MVLTIAAAVLAVVIGIVLSYVIHWFPVQASTQAHNTDRLYHVLVDASIPIFVLVVSVVLYCAWQFRMKPGEELKDGPPIHGNTRLEVFWTAIPAVILLGLVSYSFVVLRDNEKKPAREIEIGVTGQQFAWTFQYQAQAFRAGELHLVKGTPYHFELRSKDVIHSFWVPEFRMKKDAVPGLKTDIRVTPTRNGRYTLVCTELCGLGHSTMRAPVVVEDQAAFDKWAAQAKKDQNLVGGVS
jgi:cytochrome c oxidase subunit 2